MYFPVEASLKNIHKKKQKNQNRNTKKIKTLREMFQPEFPQSLLIFCSFFLILFFVVCVVHVFFCFCVLSDQCQECGPRLGCWEFCVVTFSFWVLGSGSLLSPFAVLAWLLPPSPPGLFFLGLLLGNTSAQISSNKFSTEIPSWHESEGNLSHMWHLVEELWAIDVIQM